MKGTLRIKVLKYRIKKYKINLNKTVNILIGREYSNPIEEEIVDMVNKHFWDLI